MKLSNPRLLSGVVLVLFLVMGCNKPSLPGANSDGASASGGNFSEDGSNADSSAGSLQTSGSTQPAVAAKMSGKVTTNVYGAALSIRNQADEEVFTGRFEPSKQVLEYEFEKSDGPFTYLVSIGGVAAIEAGKTPANNESIEIPFDERQLTEIRRAAGCLLTIPGAGFGSGFLLGDRQSIATAAHCVACKNVEELEIVFHPTEVGKETKVRGAKLIYFDAKQDVALLHLPEPMEEDRPYFWKSAPAEIEDKVVILGNPGRNGCPDPMYSRSATVKGTRPDEFFVDIEVKPGYSGGPVMLAGGMDVIGITSFKYVNTRDYKKDGQSFAKSANIASDAFEHWNALPSALKEQKLEREADRYSKRYHYVLANEAAEGLLLDSVEYAFALIDIARHYQLHMKVALKNLPNPVTQSRYNREKKKAHDAYIKEHGPRKAEQIKERLTPRLRMEGYYGNVYEDALADEDLPQLMKIHLRRAHDHYSNLREAAETVVDSSKRSSKGKTLEEFLIWGLEELESAEHHAIYVLNEAHNRLE